MDFEKFLLTIRAEKSDAYEEEVEKILSENFTEKDIIKFKSTVRELNLIKSILIMYRKTHPKN